MGLLLGLDISTTGAKALLIDEQGNVVASATTEYPHSTPHPLWSEQAPADWWNASCTSIRNALQQAGCKREEITCVGLTGQMHGVTG